VRLIALVDSPQHVCCRYRLSAFRPWLEQSGRCLELLSLPRRWWSRWLLFRRLRGAAVILQRTLLPSWQLNWLRQSAATLVFDFDDAVFLRDSYARKGTWHPRRLRDFARLVSVCDAVVAGNQFLAETAARWCPAERIRVIPTCVDPERYPQARHAREGERCDLVWIGSSSTLQGLERIRPLLSRLGRCLPGLRLKLLCDRFLTVPDLEVVPCRWSEAQEGEELAQADVGISWIPGDDWSRGKCGLKVLQYMAAGLPVVCNPVGVHSTLVTHGETGYLAHTPQDWVEAVCRLAASATLRRRMGRAGRQRVESDYSVGQGGRLWEQLLVQLPALHRPEGEAPSNRPCQGVAA
jgi:glycosyltransferase involved in cell wall biosynthesis